MKKEKTGCVYIAEINVPESEYFNSYIGQTIKPLEQRMKEHFYDCEKGSSAYFYSAIRKYGKENVTFRILEDNIPESRLNDREILWIAFYDTYHNGLNMTEGGTIGAMKNPIVAAKQGAVMKEKGKRGELWTQTPEGRAKQSEIQKELIRKDEHPVQTPEWRANHSRIMREKGKNNEHHCQRPEVRAKMSKTWIEKSARGEITGQKLTPDQVRSIRKEYVPKIVTQKMLAEKYNISLGYIRKILKRKAWSWLD